jgi:hypothetical protein
MKRKLFVFVLIVLVGLMFASCSEEESTQNQNVNSDIPADPQNVQVPTPTNNNVLPAATFEKTSGNENRIRVNLLGLFDPNTLQPLEITANYSAGDQNFYLQEDGILQGVKVTKVSSGNVLKTDIVFTVDMSGSMGQEADSIAASIIEFANFLSSSGLDAVFSLVGYYGNVRGAINFTNSASLSNYLNRSIGTSRVVGFAGPDSATLETAALDFTSDHSSVAEDGVVGIMFADSSFNWRAGSQRIYVNFTDEPTQPSGVYRWGTEFVCNYMLGKATIHTVYSDPDTLESWQPLVRERPWKMSQCTGGTVKFVDSQATGLDLTNLPVSGALANSYLIEYVTATPADTHTVVITIKEGDVDGRITYDGILY